MFIESYVVELVVFAGFVCILFLVYHITRPTPYEQGDQDYFSGIKEFENPYSRASANYARWNLGWNDARKSQPKEEI